MTTEEWAMLEQLCRKAHEEALKARPAEHDIPMAIALTGAFAASVLKHSANAN